MNTAKQIFPKNQLSRPSRLLSGALAILLALLLVLPATQVKAGDPAQGTQHFRQLGGVTSNEIPDDVELKWETELGKGPIDSSPVIQDGKLVVRTAGIYDWGNGQFQEKPTLFCFDISSGKKQWSTELEQGSGWELSTPLILDEKLFVPTTAGFVLAYQLDDGSKLWEVELENSSQHLGVTSSPVPCSGSASPRLVVADGTGIVYCLNAGDGSTAWETQLDGDIYFTTPVVADDRIYIGTDNGTLFSLDAGDGREVWNLSLEGKIRTTPFLDGNELYLATITYADLFTPEDGFIYKIQLKANGGEVLWSKLKEPSSSSVVCSDEALFYASDDFVLAISRTDPDETLWKARIDEQVQSSLIYSPGSGRLLVSTNSESGKLLAIDDEMGGKVWTEAISPDAPLFATPLVYGDYIVVCSDRGGVHVFVELELDVNVAAPPLPTVLTLIAVITLLTMRKRRRKASYL